MRKTLTAIQFIFVVLLSGCGGGIDTPDEDLWAGPPAPTAANVPATAGRADPCPTASKSGNPNPVCDPSDPECLCAKKVPG